jgi:hypothetical protein
VTHPLSIATLSLKVYYGLEVGEREVNCFQRDAGAEEKLLICRIGLSSEGGLGRQVVKSSCPLAHFFMSECNFFPLVRK